MTTKRAQALYVIESETEFERLERQSRTPEYDYRRELADVRIPAGSRILDCGSGSGIVARYLAETIDGASVVGCDASDIRLAQAKAAHKARRNLEFTSADVTRLHFETGSFDFALCRYVLEHLGNEENQLKAVSELHRVVKNGGSVCLIDGDGLIANLSPQPPEIREPLERLQRGGPVDFLVGRKLPQLLHKAGFSDVKWKILTIEHQGDALKREIEMMRERFTAAKGFLDRFLGSPAAAQAFISAYLATMAAPGSVYFHNVFVVTATKGN